MDKNQLDELLYQALETEQGGIKVYETALTCAQNKDLNQEWEKYLEQTRNHERIVLSIFEKLGLDPQKRTPGRDVVRHIGQSLVKAMEMALGAGDAAAAEIVAAECVVEAETKDHLNWELIGRCARRAGGETGETLKDAYDEVEGEEDEHLDHAAGWTRELWVQSLGMPAVLPPPEEEKDVSSRGQHGRVDSDS